MSRCAWAYVSGGAGEGRTMRHNRGDGVRQVIDNVVAELDLIMGLTGVERVADIGSHHLLRTRKAL